MDAGFLTDNLHCPSGHSVGRDVFFTAIVAQTVSSSLPTDTAGRVLTRVFSPYYTLTALLCVVRFVSSFGTYATNPVHIVRDSQGLIAVAQNSALNVCPVILPDRLCHDRTNRVINSQ